MPTPTEAASALLMLLGLLLAFGVSMAVSRFEARTQLVVSEANAIGTAALRSHLLPAPFAEESAALFRDYVALRVRWGEGARTSPLQPELLAAAAQLQNQLWQRAVAAGEVRRDPQHAL